MAHRLATSAKDKLTDCKEHKTMTIIQITLTVLAGILFVAAPFFDIPYETSFLCIAIVFIGLADLLASIVCFVVFLIRQKDGRKDIVLSGIRNIFLIPSVFIVSAMHDVY